MSYVALLGIRFMSLGLKNGISGLFLCKKSKRKRILIVFYLIQRPKRNSAFRRSQGTSQSPASFLKVLIVAVSRCVVKKSLCSDLYINIYCRTHIYTYIYIFVSILTFYVRTSRVPATASLLVR